MAEWVALWPIFRVCARETRYERGEKLWDSWWRQAAAEKHLKVKLEDISATARERLQWESGRCGKGERGKDGEDNKSDG